MTQGLTHRPGAVERAALDLENPRVRGHELVRRFGDTSVDAFVKPLAKLEGAIAKTSELYPSKDMKGNINAIANLARHFFGNAPIVSLTESRQEEFFAWMVRLPKTHGKRHGKYRHAERGVDLDKNDEIAAADARDAEIIEEIRGKDLSVPQKRALIAEKLTPRLGAASEGRGPTTGIGRIPADANPIMALSCHGALMACKPLPQAARRLQP